MPSNPFLPPGFQNSGSTAAQFDRATSTTTQKGAGQVRMPRTPNPAINDAFNMSVGQRGRPILFQVVDPANKPIWQFLLAMHVNPSKFDEKFTKSKNVVMTYGGFVEFIWPDDLDSISAEASTGAFMGPLVGLASGSDGGGSNVGGRDSRVGATGRHGSMAWERQEDLLDLFRQNGVIYDGNGFPAIRGRVMCIYDRGIYLGYFQNFSPKEDDSHAFSFELSFDFKVEATIYRFPGSKNAISAQAAASLPLQQGVSSQQAAVALGFSQPEVAAKPAGIVTDNDVANTGSKTSILNPNTNP